MNRRRTYKNTLAKYVIERLAKLVGVTLLSVVVMASASANDSDEALRLEQEYGVALERAMGGNLSISEHLSSEFPVSSIAAPNYPSAMPQLHAQSGSSKNIRSRSEVVSEVKRKYNAEVLKIKLNSQGSAYKVRILMSNGRVKEVTVSAKR